MARNPEVAYLAPMPAGFAELTDDEIAQRIVRHVFEADLLIRIASLRGMLVDVDVVDRRDDAHPEGYPEIHVRAGARQWP